MNSDRMDIPEEQLDYIAHIARPLGDALLMVSDTPDEAMTPVTDISIMVSPDSADEAQQLFDDLADGEFDDSEQFRVTATSPAHLAGSRGER